MLKMSDLNKIVKNVKSHLKSVFVKDKEKIDCESIEKYVTFSSEKLVKLTHITF